MSDTRVPADHRFRALDTYRFLAASGIVFYHFENHFQPFLAAPTHLLDRFHLFVDFFFALSGFVIMATYRGKIATLRDYRSFLRKRLARIYPLHLAMIVFFLLAGSVLTLLKVDVRDRSFFDVSLVPANLLLVQAWGVTERAGLNVPSWSISAEWFVYLLFPALAYVVRRSGPWGALLIAGCFAIAFDIARQGISATPLFDATFDFGNVRALPSFLAGMAVYFVCDRAGTIRVPWSIAHLAAACIVVTMVVKAPAALIVMLFPGLIALLALAEKHDRKSIFTTRIGGMLGDASYAIYMIHTPFQVAAVVIARKFGWTSVPALMTLALVTYVAIIAAGLASYRWLENPLRRRFSQQRPAMPLDRQALHAR